MAALASALPAPIYTPIEEANEGPILPVAVAANIPKYGQRKGWKPKGPADFGAGGAYPEVRVGDLTGIVDVVGTGTL